ncbi:MAG: PA2169 family four-helix-bundle protein [Desulfobacterales bacterium]|nr:PA2169 family four-helix-bundle protein [Desulfobacterales bacterium]
MDKKTTLKILDQLIQLETKVVLTYDQALETVNDSAVRAQLESLKARHADHAEQLSSQILKMANEMIAEHWDAITLAALRGQMSDSEPKMRIAANG